MVRVAAHGKNRNWLAVLEGERTNMHIAAGTKLFNQRKEVPQSWVAQNITIEQLED